MPSRLLYDEDTIDESRSANLQRDILAPTLLLDPGEDDDEDDDDDDDDDDDEDLDAQDEE